MSQRTKLILAAAFGIWLCPLHAQHAPGPGLHVPAIAPPLALRFNPVARADIAMPRPSVMAQPKAYDYHRLALFCKLEVHMDKFFRLPIRVRVGDVQYVDWLEGKRRDFR